MEMMFEVASRITNEISKKRIKANIWEGSRFEVLKDYTCDEIGEWGESLVYDVMNSDPEVTVTHGGNTILEDGHYDFYMTGPFGNLRVEQKTARLNSGPGGTFQHESLRLDGTCESFIFLDVCPNEMFLTVIASNSIKHGERHSILKRTPHQRAESKKYKFDLSRKICESRGIPAGITMRIDINTTPTEVRNFIKERLSAVS
jgi:hypothetical protein